MVVFSEEEIDALLKEDVPYFDLTTYLLGIGNERGKMEFSARHDIVVCGTEECCRLFKKAGLEIKKCLPSGSEVSADEVFLEVEGLAEGLHLTWKVAQNVLEYASGIATRTKRLVDLAKEVNENVEVVTTRKTFPFAKKLCIKAILAGGALPHRLGLSESVLVFENHTKFLGGLDKLLEIIPELKKRVPEKKIVVEVNFIEDAFLALSSGVEVVQLDKFSIEDVVEVVNFRNQKFPNAKVAAAGGINETNIKSYAATGVDIIVLTCAYFGKPADVKVRMDKC